MIAGGGEGCQGWIVWRLFRPFGADDRLPLSPTAAPWVLLCRRFAAEEPLFPLILIYAAMPIKKRPRGVSYQTRAAR